MRKEIFLVSLALVFLASHVNAQVAAERIDAQVADIALIAKVHPFPKEPPVSPPQSAPVLEKVETGHSSSLSWRELQNSLYCTRTFDFKTRKWHPCTMTDEMRQNMIASWVKNRNKVGGNIPTWINQN